MYLLLDGQSTDTTGDQDSFEFNQPLQYDYIVVRAFGTFDGATVSLEVSDDKGTTWWEAGEFTTFTAPDAGRAYLPNRVLIRGSVSGSGGSTDVSFGVL